ncbi:MAG: hypothetical protein GY811_13445 [Myxococcales bacterium]|nr:hypothetical protein [Myxococcales bacterium]
MSSRVVRVVVLLSALALLLGIGTSPSLAQRGPAMGGAPSGPTPAPATLDAKLKAGTVVVTVVAGSLEKPLANVEVFLQSETRKAARSGTDGRATFAGLGKGEYVARATAGGKTLQSEPFSMPETGGVKIVLSSVPMSNGLGGRQSARMMSGRARPEQEDPSGKLTIRAVAGELSPSSAGGLSSAVPDGATIHLVEMHAGGKMTVRSEKVDASDGGRVSFDRLARDNSIAYYAMAVFERPGGTDRLMTEALELVPQVGSRMILAGAPMNSANPGLDDLGRLSGTGNSMPGAGNVEVLVYAEASQGDYLKNTSEVELIRIGKEGGELRAPAIAAQPNSASVMGQAGPMPSLPDTEAGHVSFYGARPSTKSDIAGMKIRFELADGGTTEPSGAAEALSPATVETDAKGLAYAKDLVVGTQYVAIATMHGVEVRTTSFTPLKDAPLSFAFGYQWRDSNALQARFTDVSHDPNSIYIAKVSSGGRFFYSLPFQLTKELGASVGIYMCPELLFSLRGESDLDDQKLWFRLRFGIINLGVMPFKPSPKGMHIPLPKGFVGASVASEMTSRVGVESDKGFLWRGAVPPGQNDFIAGFALPVSDGAITFDMALPYGVSKGQIMLEELKDMGLRTPRGVKVVPETPTNGRSYLMMPDITIGPNQRLVFGLTGLPQLSPWQGRFRLVVGILALLLIGWALFAIFFGPRGAEQVDPVLAKLEAGREHMMSQLVKLETEHRRERGGSKDAQNADSEASYKKRRDKLNTKLTAIYREIDDHKSASQVDN